MGKELEQALILGILDNNHLAGELGLTAEDFTCYRGLYELISGLKPPFDLVIASGLVKPTDEWERFKECLIYASSPNYPTPSFLYRRYVEELRTERLKERVKNLSLEADGMEIDDLLLELRSAAADTKVRKNKTHSLKDSCKEAYALIEEATKSDSTLGISTGFSNLDDYTLGLQAGNLYVLAARPSIGKSAFALSLAINVARQDKKVFIHSLEDTRQSIVMRLLAQDSETPLKSLQRPDISDLPSIISKMDSIYNYNIYINDEANLSTSSIYSSVKKQIETTGVDLLIVDHLQEIIERLDFANRHLEISHSCAILKGIAKEFNIPVILISQLNRAVEQREKKRPILSDLKESGDIEQKADCVFLLYRQGYYDREADQSSAELCVAKNRNGKTGVLDFEWKGDILKFREKYRSVYHTKPYEPREAVSNPRREEARVD